MSDSVYLNIWLCIEFSSLEIEIHYSYKMSDPIDISVTLSRVRRKLDDLIDEFRDYDFTFKPLLTQQEFKDKIMPSFKNLLDSNNKYVITNNLFSNLMLESLSSLNKTLCLIDFLIYTSQYDPAFRTLPNDVLREVSDKEAFKDIQRYLSDGERFKFDFDTRLLGDSSHTVSHNEKPLGKRKPQASLEAIERSIMGKRHYSDLEEPSDRQHHHFGHSGLGSARHVAEKIARRSHSRLEFGQNPEEFGSIPSRKFTSVKRRRKSKGKLSDEPRNKKMMLVMEQNLDFLFTDIPTGGRFKPKLIKKARHGFFYRPPRYSLFAKYDKQSDSEVANNMDNLFNSFLQQASKRAAYGDFDETPFLHETEYNYIMNGLDKFRDLVLPPLIFDERTVISKAVNGDDRDVKVTKTMTKVTKVKNLMRLKVFRGTREYMNKFGSIITDPEVAKQRVQWINSLVTDGKGIYSCDKLDTIVTLIHDRPMLCVETEDEESDDDTNDDETEGNNDDLIIKREEDDDTILKNIHKEAPKSTVKDVEEEATDLIPRNSTLFVTATDKEDKEINDDDNDDEVLENMDMDKPNDNTTGESKTTSDNTPKESIAHDISLKELNKKNSMILHDNRTAVYTTARGIKLNSSHIKKHLSIKDFMRILANLVFPGLKIGNRIPDKEVMLAVRKGYSKVFFNFRPYLIELFLKDLNNFFTMPKFFKMDSVMFELQLEDLRDRVKTSHKAAARPNLY